MFGQEYRRVPVSQFREGAGMWMEWVAQEGGHVWLTRHGREVAAVIPFYQLKMLEELMGTTETRVAERLERDYTRFRAAKTVQAHEEAARLLAGDRIGGAARTAKMQETLDRKRDPWEDDPVLITSSPRRKRLVFERDAVSPEADGTSGGRSKR